MTDKKCQSVYGNTLYFRHFIGGYVGDVLRWSKYFYALRVMPNYKSEAGDIYPCFRLNHWQDFLKVFGETFLPRALNVRSKLVYIKI